MRRYLGRVMLKATIRLLAGFRFGRKSFGRRAITRLDPPLEGRVGPLAIQNCQALGVETRLDLRRRKEVR